MTTLAQKVNQTKIESFKDQLSKHFDYKHRKFIAEIVRRAIAVPVTARMVLGAVVEDNKFYVFWLGNDGEVVSFWFEREFVRREAQRIRDAQEQFNPGTEKGLQVQLINGQIVPLKIAYELGQEIVGLVKGESIKSEVAA